MISRCQGDDTFFTFQPMGIFRFMRNRKFKRQPKDKKAVNLFSQFSVNNYLDFPDVKLLLHVHFTTSKRDFNILLSEFD